jgi:hypothetical protein
MTICYELSDETWKCNLLCSGAAWRDMPPFPFHFRAVVGNRRRRPGEGGIRSKWISNSQRMPCSVPIL